jgi:hypothetical protein
MKKLFAGYYPPSEEEFDALWKQCTFIFDTNILLDFYQHRKETREDFFKILDNIKDRLWIPHQVALEYHNNMDKEKLQAKVKFDSAKKFLDQITEDIEKKLSTDFSLQWFCHETVKEMIEDVKKVSDTLGIKLASYKEELIKGNEIDEISDKIADLFDKKVGKIPSQEELEKIYSDGEKRYEICRPPGFSDIKKDKNKDKSFYIHEGLVFKKIYGDLIIWKQILEEVKDKPLTHIIFVTDDRKPDWWREEHGRTIGPRPELIEEIKQAGAHMFYMYKPDRFLEYAGKHLELGVKKESIQEVEEISLLNTLSEPELQDNSFIQLGVSENDINTIRRVGTRIGPSANNPSYNIRLGPHINTSLNKNNLIDDLIKQLELLKKLEQGRKNRYGL